MIILDYTVPNITPEKIISNKRKNSVEKQKNMNRMKMCYERRCKWHNNFKNKKKRKEGQWKPYYKFQQSVKMRSHCCIVLVCSLIVNLLRYLIIVLSCLH